MPFPLSLILPGRMSKGALNRILLTRGEPPFYHLREVEAQVWLELPSQQGLSGGGTRESRDETTGLVKIYVNIVWLCYVSIYELSGQLIIFKEKTLK